MRKQTVENIHHRFLGTTLLFGALSLLAGSFSATAAGRISHADRKWLFISEDNSEINSSKICDPSVFRIALDIGHTIQASGATSARGVTEHTFNINLAAVIAQSLQDAGFRNTYLLTTTGTGIRQLEERTTRANALGVDLLLSIHHDDVQPTYYSTWEYDGKRYHFSDRFSGYSIFVSYENRHRENSLAFAKLLGDQLLARGLHFNLEHAENIPGENRELVDPKRGVYRYDQLFVLRNSVAPAALLEAGVITNRDEEVLLSSSERKAKIGAAIVAAASQFCSEIQGKTIHSDKN